MDTCCFSIEGQKCKQTFESIRKLDPYNLDFMDIYSNILFVLVRKQVFLAFQLSRQRWHGTCWYIFKEEHAQLAILAQEACEIDKYRPESCCIIGENWESIFMLRFSSGIYLFCLWRQLLQFAERAPQSCQLLSASFEAQPELLAGLDFDGPRVHGAQEQHSGRSVLHECHW